MTPYAECVGFFDKVFSDLDERCTNAAEVSARYQDSMACVTDQVCTDLFSACESERDAYEQALQQGGEGCQPDDD